MKRANTVFVSLVGLTAALFCYLIVFIFFKTPTAQLAAGGITQKIFYFHAPAAYAMYLCGVVCLAASAAYLLRETAERNALAQASAECAVVFGMMVLTSGPLWAKKAWGVYWTWDPRLTTLLLSVLIYAAVVVVRRFAGDGPADRRAAAAIGVLGTVLLPIIHYSVALWGGNHPTVITKGGGGLGHPAMTQALMMGFAAMTLLSIILMWLRTDLIALKNRLASVEQEALEHGIEI